MYEQKYTQVYEKMSVGNPKWYTLALFLSMDCIFQDFFFSMSQVHHENFEINNTKSIKPLCDMANDDFKYLLSTV